ncbi:MAG: hypothetical protein JXQ65_11220 [Candidatus Marinimicrobia bacterium]|nr:hypothetical protein [Candidatus Neomarinimicrobiota bacterium]
MFSINKFAKLFVIIMIALQVLAAQSWDMRIHQTAGPVDRIAVDEIVDITFQDGTSGKEIVIEISIAPDYVAATSGIDSITFQETGTVTDIDGNTYKTVKIGDQWWMAENLRVTQYRDGTSIPYVTNSDGWNDQNDNETGAYCAYDDTPGNVDPYGYLYNWFAVNGDIDGDDDKDKEIAPAGWHVPTDDEWEALKDYLTINGHSGTEGTALKSTSGWILDRNGTDDYGFNGIPAGYRIDNGPFYDEQWSAYFWTATEYDRIRAYCRRLRYNNNEIGRFSTFGKEYGYSIRCIRD